MSLLDKQVFLVKNTTKNYEYSFTQKYISTIIGLKFGHACYPVYLYKIHDLDLEIDIICQEKGDLNHIF